MYSIIIKVLLLGAFGSINAKAIQSITVTGKSARSVEIKMSTGKINYSDFKLDGETFVRFDLGDMGEINEIGNPNLPAVRRLVEGPVDAEPEIEVISINKTMVNLKQAGILHRIMPSYPPVVKMKGEVPHLVMNNKIYGHDGLWPSVHVRIKKAGIIRGHQLYQVEFFPLSYNPVKGMLEVVRDIDVRITFKQGNTAETEQGVSRLYSPFFEHMLSKKVLNYGIFEDKLNPAVPVGYLIVTPSSFVTALSPFVKWKTEEGYHVTVATIPDSIAQGDTLSVRNYILNAYNNWTIPPTFVLLVGDVGQISNWWSSAADDPANDLWYSLMDSGDTFPDLFIGRFSATTDSMLSVIVNKVLSYEQTLWGADTLWANKAFFIASADPDNHTIAEATHSYCMGIVRAHGMITDSLWGYSTSGCPTIITNTVNDGRAMVTYSGHGSETGWADYGDLQYSVSDLYSNFTNGVKLPFEETYACLTGHYTTEECFQEAWQRAPDKGAAAAFGSSVTSYWDEDDILQRRLYDELFDTGYVWVMGAIDEGKIDLYNHYSGGGRTYRYFCEYNLFGDPSMYLYFNIPKEIAASYAPSVPMGNTPLQVDVSDLSGALSDAFVSAVQNDKVLDAQYTDNSGTALLNIQPTTTDTVYVIVTALNHKPYFGYTMVSTSGAYVSYLKGTIDDASGNNDGNINPGEQINYGLWVRNWGQDTAYNVTGIISTSDTFVNITGNATAFGTVADGDSAQGSSAFGFSVSNNVPDNHNIDFTLQTVYDDTGATDTSVGYFSLKVYAPAFSVSSVNVIDTIGGDNGDNVAQPAETVDINLVTANIGHEDAANVYARISCQNSNITILRDSSLFGNIPVSQTVASINPFRISIDQNMPVPSFPVIYVHYVTGNYSFDDSFRITVGNTGYFTNFETADTADWSCDNPWHVTEHRYHSATHAFYFGTEGSWSYPNNANASLTSPAITLGPSSVLSFWTWYNLESGYDYGYVEVSSDNGATWHQLMQLNGSADWSKKIIDLSSYSSGTSVLIRFRAVTDASQTYEGWYVDDVIVTPPAPPPTLSLKDVAVDDAAGNNDGFADPGENIKLVVSIENLCEDTVFNTTAKMVSLSDMGSVTDSTGNFGNIIPSSFSTDTFGITISQNAYAGYKIHLLFFVDGNGGTFEDTLSYYLTVGDKRQLPQGPDSYGYYIYTTGDICTETPVYNWADITGSGTLVADGDDSSEVVQLPFSFKYYGTTYNSITVCSNGWIALGDQSSSHALSNVPLPDPSSPNNMIAGVWDDLNPVATGSGKIYYYSDTQNHRFIVEYDNVYHYGSTSPEKFEIILYDPSNDPTLTGDGEIIVQYASKPTQWDFTTGIENADGSIGLTYVCDSSYDSYALPIDQAFALKATTDTPVYVAVSERRNAIRSFIYALMPASPNPFRSSTSIRFSIARDTHVSLNIYDINGRLIRTLADRNMKRGIYSMLWNGRDKTGRKLSSGVYFYRLNAGMYRKSRKIILLK